MDSGTYTLSGAVYALHNSSDTMTLVWDVPPLVGGKLGSFQSTLYGPDNKLRVRSVYTHLVTNTFFEESLFNPDNPHRLQPTP